MIKTGNFVLVNKFFLPYSKFKLSVDEQDYVKLHLDQPILIVWNKGNARYGVLAEVYSFDRGLNMKVNLHLQSTNVVLTFRYSNLEFFYQVIPSNDLTMEELLKLSGETMRYLNKSLSTLLRENGQGNLYNKVTDLTSVIKDFLSRLTRYLSDEEYLNLNSLINEIFTFMCNKNNLRFFFWSKSLVSKMNMMKAIIAYRVQANLIQLRIRRSQDKKLESFQRQAYINNQIQVFKEQLDEDKNLELDNLSTKWKQAPESFRSAFKRELSKLKSMPSAALPEYFNQKKLVECLSRLPWTSSKVDVNMEEARQSLEQSHYNLNEVKDQVMDFITLTKYASKLKVLCLVGAPGLGKTSIAKVIAKVLGRDFIYINLAGCWDSVMLKGTQRVYTNSHPGTIISKMSELSYNDPVILLDEIDKTKSDLRRGSASNLEQALIELLDKDNNLAFKDLFLEESYDLSKVLFITTANDLSQVPEPLLNRLDIIRIQPYDVEEKIDIAQGWLIPKLKKEFNVDVNLEIDRSILYRIINDYTLESGVRKLESRLKTLMVKWLRDINLELSSDILELIFKNQKVRGDSFTHDDKFVIKCLGQSLGMYASSLRGGVSQIDVVRIPMMESKNNNQTWLTGLQGDTLKESFRVALTGLYSSSRTWNLEETIYDFISKNHLHFHMLPGSIHRDGPSAGLAIATAIMSIIIQEKVPEIPMTGEIGVRGEVLAIGGIKEKINGAKRNNFFQVILPEANRRDVENANVKDVKVIFVKNLQDAFQLFWPTHFSNLSLT